MLGGAATIAAAPSETEVRRTTTPDQDSRHLLQPAQGKNTAAALRICLDAVATVDDDVPTVANVSNREKWASLILILACMPCLQGTCLAVEPVITYPAPQGEKASKDYEVEVGGKRIFVYTAPVLRDGPASFAYFDIAEPVTVTVTVARKIGALKILPTSYGVTPTVAANKVSFTISKPAHLTIEPSGNGERPLHLFANPHEANPPDPASKDVIYFGPGVHDVTTIRPKSGQIVYLAGGAILRARIAPHEKPVEEKNWRGNKVYAPLIEASRRQGREGLRAGDSRLGGAALACADRDVVRQFPRHPRRGDCHSRRPRMGRGDAQLKEGRRAQREGNLRGENSDGVDICNSQDVLVEDCFLRNNDDEVCVKTLSPPPAMESKNIVVRRIVVWNDRARGLGITSETRANISHVLFQDCDIIHDFSQGGDCAALAVLVSDSGTMSDIRFENIRCEDVRHTLANCWIGADMWGHDKSRGHIKGVTFKDVQATGPVFPVSKLSGFDDAHLVEDVTFERLRIQGKPIGDAAAARLQTNSYVRRVKFIPASGRP